MEKKWKRSRQRKNYEQRKKFVKPKGNGTEKKENRKTGAGTEDETDMEKQRKSKRKHIQKRNRKKEWTYENT